MGLLGYALFTGTYGEFTIPVFEASGFTIPSGLTAKFLQISTATFNAIQWNFSKDIWNLVPNPPKNTPTSHQKVSPFVCEANPSMELSVCWQTAVISGGTFPDDYYERIDTWRNGSLADWGSFGSNPNTSVPIIIKLTDEGNKYFLTFSYDESASDLPDGVATQFLFSSGIASFGFDSVTIQSNPVIIGEHVKKITNFYLADFSGEAPVERPQPIELERLQSTELRFCAVYEDGEFEEWTGGVEYSAYVGDGAFSFEGRELTILENARSPQIIASFRPVYDNVSEGAFASVNIKVTNPLGPNDPYSPGGFGQQTNPTGPGSPTIPGGSTGTPSGPSSGKWDDAIGGTSVPGHSPISSTSTGLFRTYSMSISDIQALGQKLWSANVLDVLSKYFENPADLIMGILEFPFSLPSGTREEIKFNWLPTDISTLDVQGGLLAQEYQVLDFGTINIPRISGMFYDYQPYTTAEIFLPYIGFVPIKYSEIVDSTLHLEYCVSLVTGSACAVLVSGKAGVIGTYNAIIGRNLPITARDFSSVYTSLAKAGLAATAGLVGAGVGAAAGMAANSFSSDVSNFYRPAAVSTIGRIETAANIGTQMTGHFTRNFGQSAINSVSNANGNITRSGHFDAAVGRCSNQNAFVLVSAPHQNLPAAYGHTIGYPTNIGGYLGQFSGYTEIRSINIVAEGATATELVEIENLLKGGIII